jgi:hypothetical protein
MGDREIPPRTRPTSRLGGAKPMPFEGHLNLPPEHHASAPGAPALAVVGSEAFYSATLVPNAAPGGDWVRVVRAVSAC